MAVWLWRNARYSYYYVCLYSRLALNGLHVISIRLAYLHLFCCGSMINAAYNDIFYQCHSRIFLYSISAYLVWLAVSADLQYSVVSDTYYYCNLYYSA